MKIILSPRAEKQLRKLSKFHQIVIARKIRKIRNAKMVAGEKSLRSYKNIFRARVGDLRIVYKKTKSQIYVVLIAHRKEIYQLVERLLR